MGAMDFLKKQAKPVEKSKKGKSPVLELANTEDNRKLLQTIITEKKNEKTAEDNRKKAEAQLRPICDSMRTQHCQTEHEFHASIEIKCGDIGPVRYQNQNRYSKIETDKEEELKAEAGPEYDNLFKLQTKIDLTELGLKKIEELLPLLQAAADKVCGEAGSWSKIFAVEQYIEPTDKFHEQKILDPKINGIAKNLETKGLVKQTTSSFVVS